MRNVVVDNKAVIPTRVLPVLCVLAVAPVVLHSAPCRAEFGRPHTEADGGSLPNQVKAFGSCRVTAWVTCRPRRL